MVKLTLPPELPKIQGLGSGTFSFTSEPYNMAIEGLLKKQTRSRKAAKKVRRRQKQQMSKVITDADAGRLVRKAAEFLEDRLWTKNTLHNSEKDAYCIAGAINRVYCGNAELGRHRIEQIPLLNVTYSLLDSFLGRPIEGFNDQTSTLKPDVLAKLHKFADEYDPQRI